MVDSENAVYLGIDREIGNMRLVSGRWYVAELKCPLFMHGCYSVRVYSVDGSHVDIRYADTASLLKEWWFKRKKKEIR